MTPGKKQAFEPTGLIPRSIVRTFERFYKQLLPRTKYSAIREYRISRYQVLVSLRCLCTLLILPLVTRIIANWLIFPQIQYFWDITYQDSHVFSEIDQFSQVIFFDSLLDQGSSTSEARRTAESNQVTTFWSAPYIQANLTEAKQELRRAVRRASLVTAPKVVAEREDKEVFAWHPSVALHPEVMMKLAYGRAKHSLPMDVLQDQRSFLPTIDASKESLIFATTSFLDAKQPKTEGYLIKGELFGNDTRQNNPRSCEARFAFSSTLQPKVALPSVVAQSFATEGSKLRVDDTSNFAHKVRPASFLVPKSEDKEAKVVESGGEIFDDCQLSLKADLHNQTITQLPSVQYVKVISELKNKIVQDQALQEKIFELAQSSHFHALQSLTNVFADFLSILVLIFLLITLRPEITILKSFLVEVIYNLSDTTKSFLLILMTDLLVGFHSPRGWETMFSLILYHFGLPENQDFVFLFVATLPVILDTVFKYWIFRHLNKISPSTVATYHNMIE